MTATRNDTETPRLSNAQKRAVRALMAKRLHNMPLGRLTGELAGLTEDQVRAQVDAYAKYLLPEQF